MIGMRSSTEFPNIHISSIQSDILSSFSNLSQGYHCDWLKTQISLYFIMAPQEINWAIYHSLPIEQAQYQVAHIHQRRTKDIATSYFICLPIAFIAIIMRFVSRRIGRSSYGADDWVMVVAMVRHWQHLRSTKTMRRSDRPIDSDCGLCYLGSTRYAIYLERSIELLLSHR